MKERSNQPQNPPAENEPPGIYSISQDKDGSFHFSRRDLLYFSAAIGGTLLVRGVCPRFGAMSAPSEPVQAGKMTLPRVSIHAKPSITSNIADTLQQNDFVRLISDHPDLGWVEVATQNVQRGWVERSFVDFSRATKSSSPNFDLSSTLTPTPTHTPPPLTSSIQLRGGDYNPEKVLAAGQVQSCGEVIQNGDFEAGRVSWVEVSPGVIIRNDWSSPHQGSWVAWFGGVDVVERLTQRFHVPVGVEDAQRLYFYLQVTTQETGSQVYDTFRLHFLDAGENPIRGWDNVMIADNTTPTNWVQMYVDLTGMSWFADQDIHIQFEGDVNASRDTYFVIDSVSLNLTCRYYVYLPVVVNSPTPTPTQTPTSTPSPSATPCPNHNPCPSHCSGDCSSDCVYVCPSDCWSDCIYYCPFDCIYHCGFN